MQNRLVSLALPARVAFGFLLAVASSRSLAAETGRSEVAENGKQTSQNLVANDDFERGLDGWQAPQGVPGKADIVPGPHGSCVRLSSTTNETSTYVTQTLNPQRQEVYREVVRSIYGHAQRAHWPPLLFYAVDEPNELTDWTYYNPAPWTDEYNDLRGQFKSCHLVYRGADGELIRTLT